MTTFTLEEFYEETARFWKLCSSLEWWALPATTRKKAVEALVFMANHVAGPEDVQNKVSVALESALDNHMRRSMYLEVARVMHCKPSDTEISG